MDSAQTQQIIIRNESDGLYFFAIMLKYKVFIIIMTILAAIASIIIALSMPVWYASTVNFVPPNESAASGGGGSSLSAVMRDFGLAKVGGGGSTEYTMLVFLESRTVIDSIIKKHDIENTYDMKGDKMSNIRLAFRSNVDVQYLDEGNYEITVWDRNNEKAADIANDYVQIANHFIQVNHKNELDANITYLTNRIKSIDSSINTLSSELHKISKTKNIYSPEEQSKAAATAMGSLKNIEVEQEIMYNYFKNAYGEDDSRAVNAKELHTTIQNKVKDAFSKPGFVGNVALNDVTPVAIDYITKYVDVEAFTQIKALLATSLEKTKLDSYSSTPSFFIVDKAIPADQKDKPKRSFIVAGGTFAGFILSILIILLVNGIRLAVRQSKNLLNENNK